MLRTLESSGPLDRVLPPGVLIPRILRFLRSSLFVAIVSLFVATGYGRDVLDYHCHDGRPEQSHTEEGDHHGEKAGDDGGGCQCLCHQMFTTHAAEAVRVGCVAVVSTEFVGSAVEFPPEALPVGIDHPPQLA